MVRRILIAFDFSRESARAVAYGIELAEQLGAEPVVITVLDVADLRVAMRAGLHGFEDDAAVRRMVRRWIADQDAQLLGDTNARRVIRRGIPEQEILTAATRLRAGMIVMGPTGLGRRSFGSVTREVLRRSPVPVVVVPPRRERH